MRKYGSASVSAFEKGLEKVYGRLDDQPKAAATAVQTDEPTVKEVLTKPFAKTRHPIEAAHDAAVTALRNVIEGDPAAELLSIRWSQTLGSQREVAEGRRVAVEGVVRESELWHPDVMGVTSCLNEDTSMRYVFKGLGAGRIDDTGVVVLYEQEHDLEGMIDPVIREHVTGVNHWIIAARVNATEDELRKVDLPLPDMTIEKISILQSAARQAGYV